MWLNHKALKFWNLLSRLRDFSHHFSQPIRTSSTRSSSALRAGTVIQKNKSGRRIEQSVVTKPATAQKACQGMINKRLSQHHHKTLRIHKPNNVWPARFTVTPPRDENEIKISYSDFKRAFLSRGRAHLGSALSSKVGSDVVIGSLRHADFVLRSRDKLAAGWRLHVLKLLTVTGPRRHTRAWL